VGKALAMQSGFRGGKRGYRSGGSESRMRGGGGVRSGGSLVTRLMA
jgi:hypothetical protein